MVRYFGGVQEENADTEEGGYCDHLNVYIHDQGPMHGEGHLQQNRLNFEDIEGDVRNLPCRRKVR